MSLQFTKMKVSDLRKELEKRGLDKSGVKSVLIERLRCARKEIDRDEHQIKNNGKSETASSEILKDDVNTFKNLNEIRQKLKAEESTPFSNEELEDKQRVTEISPIKATSQIHEDSSKDAEKNSNTVVNTDEKNHENKETRSEERPTGSIVKKSKVTAVKKKNESQESACEKTDQEAKHEPDCNKTIISDDNGHSIPEGGHHGNDRPIFNRGRESFRRPFYTRDRRVPFAGRDRFSDIRRPFRRPSPFDQPDYHISSRVTYGFHYKGSQRDRDMLEREKQREGAWRLEEKNRLRLERELFINEEELLKVRREQLELDWKKLHHQRQMSSSKNKTFRGQREFPSHDFLRRNNYENLFHKEKFLGKDEFPYRCENSTYKKATFMHDEFRREKMETAPSHSRYDEHMQGLSREFSRRNRYDNFFQKEKFSGEDRFSYRRNEFFCKRDEFMHEFRREKMETPPSHSRYDERKVKYHSGSQRSVYLKSEFREPRPSSSSSIKYSSRRSGDTLGYAPRSKKIDYH